MTRQQVVVIGGTGAVGREITALVADGGTDVVVVARHEDRAAEVAREVAERRRNGSSPGTTSASGRDHPRAVTARRADVGDPAERRAALAGATVVVTSVERANVDIATEALAQGAHVVDISATPNVLAAIERLDGPARANHATAVVDVGLAPGLTNLLARACVDRQPNATAVDIAVLVGMGEHHGVDAVRWTLDGLAAPSPRGARPQRVAFPGFGRRTAHPFPFADQHSLAGTLGLPVTTRICFDSRAVTAAAFALRRTRLLARLPRSVLAPALARVHAGSDRFAVTVTASSPGRRPATATATGHRQSHATAVVTAHVVRLLLDGGVTPGVHHIDQILEVDAALDAVEAAGITLDRP